MSYGEILGDHVITLLLTKVPPAGFSVHWMHIGNGWSLTMMVAYW